MKKIKIAITVCAVSFFALLFIVVKQNHNTYPKDVPLRQIIIATKNVATSSYPATWEKGSVVDNKGNIERLPLFGTINGDPHYDMVINATKMNKESKLLNANPLKYILRKYTNLNNKDNNFVECWCIDKIFYSYPACSSTITLTPYLVNTNIYLTSQRCSAHSITPHGDIIKFISVSNDIEVAIKEILNQWGQGH